MIILNIPPCLRQAGLRGLGAATYSASPVRCLRWEPTM